MSCTFSFTYIYQGSTVGTDTLSLNVFRTLPKISGDDFESIFNELDDTGDFKVLTNPINTWCLLEIGDEVE